LKTILKVFVILFGLSALSQTKALTKKGLVFDRENKSPLPYVNIYNQANKIGTVSNELGQFILRLPDSISDKTVTFSSLGFKNKTISFFDIKDTIFLEPSVQELTTVEISNNRPSIKQILFKVYDNLKKNYSNKRHLLKAFYRQTAIRDSLYERIIEADISIQEYGVAKQLDRDRIKVNQYRRSNDLLSSKYKFYWKMASKLFSDKNEMVWLKKANFITNFSKNKAYNVYHKTILDNYIFEFDSMTSIDNNLVYVFTFYSKDFEKIPLAESQLSKIYISTKDFAVLRIVLNFGIRSLNKFHELSKNEYSYSKIGDYYYLTSARKYTNYLNKEIIIDNMYVYEVMTDRKSYNKIKRKQAEHIDTDFSKRDYTYDATFWKNYKILPVIPIKDRMKKIIEEKEKLNKQYNDNANKN